MAKEIKLDTKIEKIRKTEKINIFGVVLILIGAMAIWNQVAPIRVNWNFFWPGLLILVGIFVLFKR